MNKHQERHYLQCGKVLVGRIDKRFCDAYCRNTYNNQNKSDDERNIQHTKSLLRANRTILKQLCPEGKAIIRKELLNNLNYRFDLFTSVYRTPKHVYYLCYEYGYAPIIENKRSGEIVEKALIIQKQEYMNHSNHDPWKKLSKSAS